MALLKDDALVLGRHRLGESSSIVTLFTRKHGPARVVAKGARRARSKFVGVLEPTNLVHAVYYRKENRDLHLLSQCDSVQSFPGLRESLLRLAYAYAIIDCLVGLKREESAAHTLLDLACRALETIESAAETALEGTLWSFLLAALEDAGFRPELDQCVQCGQVPAGQNMRFHASAGGITCRDHGSGGLLIAGETREFLAASAGPIAPEGISSRSVSEGREALRRFLAEYGLGHSPFRTLEDLVRRNRVDE